MKKNIKSINSMIMSIINAFAFFMVGYFYAQYRVNINYGNEIFKICTYLLLVITIYGIHVIIHELGHLCFGKLTGYKFVSFRIGNFMIIKKDKLEFKKLSIAGTLGQCLMAPPALENDRIPYILYNLGGSLFNLISSIILLIIYFLVDNLLVKVILIVMIIIGILICLTNILPLEMIVNNDGYNVLSLYKNPKSIYYFWLQLKVNELLSKDISLAEMNEEWFKMPKADDLNDSFVALVAVMICNRLLEKGDYNKTKESIEYILSLETGIVEIHQNLLVCDLIYCKLILGELDIDELLTKKQTKFMKMMNNFISVIRVEYAISSLYENNIEKSSFLKQKFIKICKNYPYTSDLKMEEKLMELVDSKKVSSDN